MTVHIIFGVRKASIRKNGHNLGFYQKWGTRPPFTNFASFGDFRFSPLGITHQLTHYLKGNFSAKRSFGVERGAKNKVILSIIFFH